MLHCKDDRRPHRPGDAKPGLPSPNLRRLLERMRTLGFGAIRGLHIRAGEPLFDPPPQVIRTARLSGDDESRPGSTAGEFVMKREQIALQRQLAFIGTGVIDVIKVHDGLPVHLEIQESA